MGHAAPRRSMQQTVVDERNSCPRFTAFKYALLHVKHSPSALVDWRDWHWNPQVSSLHRIRSAETLARASHASPDGLSTELPTHVTCCGVNEHTLDAKSPSYRLPENQLGVGTATQDPWPGEFQNGHDGFHASACAPPPMVPACQCGAVLQGG